MLWSKLKKLWAIEYFLLPNFHGFHPVVVTTLLSFPPSRGFAPCRGYQTFVNNVVIYKLVKSHSRVMWHSESANRKAQLNEISVVCTLSWLPNFHGFHPVVVTTLLSFPPSCGLHLVVVTKLSWFSPCCGYHTFVVSTLPWFAPCRGYQTFVVSTLSWLPHFCCFHPPVVSSLSWLPHFHHFHPPVVTKLLWFPPSHGYSVVSILDFGLN